MKNFLIILMVIQIILIGIGCYQLSKGQIAKGLFNIIINLVFIGINYSTIQKL